MATFGKLLYQDQRSSRILLVHKLETTCGLIMREGEVPKDSQP
jgi:hypothetical protein